VKQALGVWAGQGLGNGVDQGVKVVLGHVGVGCYFLPSAVLQSGQRNWAKNSSSRSCFGLKIRPAIVKTLAAMRRASTKMKALSK
jgi:hypothetical protein